MEVGAVGPRRVDVERIEPPDISLRGVWARRTILLERLARGEEDAAVAVHEVAARRLPLPVRHAVDARSIDVHHVLLVAGSAISGTLENQALPIVAEIGLGVFSAVGELTEVLEMRFAGLGRNAPGRRLTFPLER